MMKFGLMKYKTGKFVADNSPTILTALGATGLVMTAFLTGKASFKASEFLYNSHENPELKDKLEYVDGFLTPRTKFELCWKFYIPAAVAGSLSIAAIIGANRVGTRRAAAATAAYAISERAYSEYRDKVVETIGKNKEQKLRDELMQDRIDRHPVSNHNIIETGQGKDLCYDTWNGRYFYSSMEAIKHAQNRLNYKINNSYYASLTDFYDYLGLDRTKTSDDFGWNSTQKLEINFPTTISDQGSPVLIMDFLVHPIRGYESVH